MSATSQPADFSDLYTSLLHRARSESSQTISLNNAKSFINTALFDMHIGHGEKFPWAERRDTLRTQPPYSTGTVDVTKGSQTLTGNGTAWDANNDFSVANVRVGGKFKIDSDETIYEVTAVNGATDVTVDLPYRRETDTAVGYEYWEDEYDLASDFLKPLDHRHFDSYREIEIMDRREYRRLFTRRTTTGEVVACTIFDRAFSGDTTPRRRIGVWRPPSEADYIPYAYVTSNFAVASDGTEKAQLVSDTDEPIVPLYARHAIVLYALGTWYRDKKNDDRATGAFNEYQSILNRLETDVEIGSRRPQIQPVMAPYRQKSRSPYRSRRGGRYTTGSSFDENR